MLRKFYLLTLTFLLVFLFAGCDDDDNPLIAVNKLTIDRFPTQIGTVWKYHRYDSVTNIQDTVTVTAKPDTVHDWCYGIGCGSSVIFEYHYSANDSTDIRYVFIFDSTVAFMQPYEDTLFTEFLIEFPIEVGNGWNNGLTMADSSFVDKKELISPYNREIVYNSFHVERYIGNTFDYFKFQYWYVPDIGLAQYHIQIYTEGLAIDVNESWQLIDFYEPDSLTLEQFPIEVGNSWVYEVYDNYDRCLSCGPDTVVATITYMFDSQSGYKSYVIDFFSGRLFSTIIDVKSDTVIIRWENPFLIIPLQFPLTIGKRWPSQNPNDSNEVIDKRSVTVPMGTFNSAYYIEGGWMGFDDAVEYNIWMEKDIGIVRLDYNTVSMIPHLNQNQSWRLVEFYSFNSQPNFNISNYPIKVGSFWEYEVEGAYRK